MNTYIEFQNRRKNLIDNLGDGIAIISNSDESSRNRDCDYPFRSDSYFHYLSGFPEPEAVILIVGGNQPRSVIFCKPKEESKEIWNGYIYGPEEAAKQFLFDESYSLDDINKIMPKILRNYIPNKNIYCIPSKIPSNSGLKTNLNIQNWVSKKNVVKEYCDLSKILDSMRRRKSEGEINIMQKSANIAAQAHIHAMRITKPGKYEYQIEGEILNQFMQNGARYPAYSSIVASGNNACTLHYVENKSILKDGDLLLIDAGCELESYASDITRTYPINGKFSSAQKDIYQVVLNAQKEAINKVIPGNYFDAPHNAALEQIVNGLIDLKILKASRDEVFEKELYNEFFMHRTSHWLGLDVHDAGQYFEDFSEQSKSKSVKFQDSNVLTVEPGCYIKPNNDVPKEFWGIGIRIEDDVLVTSKGNKVLSASAPKEIIDLEDIVGNLNE
ncbi:aminopeptidase P N-terminal domain-containing protein [Methylophilaceae bacterium]|nr:aminopeptidase P N-terminal domain-containing protein [Methylophilaceae bacterium]